jgi:peptide/nickel transport system substrate-binding protein
VEWHVIPDAGTAAAALQSGEMDWWENPTADLQALLRRNRNIAVEIEDPTGLIGILRFNQLHPPFDNPAIRRALLGAVSQRDFMTAVIGTDASLWREGVGVFAPGTPMASDHALEPLTGPRDPDRVRAELRAAGYTNQRITLLQATDFPTLNALALVGADMMRRVGMNVDVQSLDWGTVVQRRASREPPARGGWNAFFTFWAGLDHFNPAGHLSIRGNGAEAWFGWPTAPRLEELRDAWFQAPDLPAQQAIARNIQAQAMQDVPYIPLGQYFQATAYRRNLSGMLKGFALFWKVQRN